MRRPTIRLGSLMLIVIAVALIIHIYVRHDIFYNKYKFHAAEANYSSSCMFNLKTRMWTIFSREPRGEWHAELAEKYRMAARYPWLPVAADPPAPPYPPGMLAPAVPVPAGPLDSLEPGRGPVPKSRKFNLERKPIPSQKTDVELIYRVGILSFQLQDEPRRGLAAEPPP